VDPQRGALTALAGFPMAVGASPFALAAVGHDPLGHFEVVTEAGLVHVFAVDPNSGALQEVPSSPTMMPGNSAWKPMATTITFDPSGKFLYMSSNLNREIPCAPGCVLPPSTSIFAYAMDATTGALTPVPGSPYTTPGVDNTGCCMAVSSDGGLIFVADKSYLSAYRIDAATGALTLASSVPVEAYALALDPESSFAYLSTGSALTSVKIGPNGNSLTVGTTSTFENKSAIEAMVIDPSGRFAYTAEEANAQGNPALVGTYAISNGSFTNIGTVNLGTYGELSLALGASHSVLYASDSDDVNGTNEVLAWSINASNGVLNATPVADAPLGAAPLSLSITTPQ
jgi:6-phosphogluconolactonase (cycloisomerase 2 family)